MSWLPPSVDLRVTPNFAHALRWATHLVKLRVLILFLNHLAVVKTAELIRVLAASPAMRALRCFKVSGDGGGDSQRYVFRTPHLVNLLVASTAAVTAEVGIAKHRAANRAIRVTSRASVDAVWSDDDEVFESELSQPTFEDADAFLDEEEAALAAAAAEAGDDAEFDGEHDEEAESEEECDEDAYDEEDDDEEA